MKASMDVIRKTAGEMIDQLTEELEIILEEKQKTELHEKYGILVDALEAAGFCFNLFCQTVFFYTQAFHDFLVMQFSMGCFMNSSL